VSALYEQGRIRHVIPDLAANPLAELEEEMRRATSNGYFGEGSPNRMDALVWALTDLFLADAVAGAGYLELARRDMAQRTGERASAASGFSSGAMDQSKIGGPS
jgi:hypothetical protein